MQFLLQFLVQINSDSSQKKKTEILPKTQKMVIVEAPFLKELLGMAIIQVLDMSEHVTNMIKLKFIRNRATLKITNNTCETVTF